MRLSIAAGLFAIGLATAAAIPQPEEPQQMTVDQFHEVIRIKRCLKHDVPENCNVPEWYETMRKNKEKHDLEQAAYEKEHPPRQLTLEQINEIARINRCLKNDVPENCNVSEFYKSFPMAKEKLEKAAEENYIPPSVPRCLPGLDKCRDHCWAWIVTSPWFIPECRHDCEVKHCPHNDEDGPVYDGGQ